MHPSPEILPANDAHPPRRFYVASPVGTYRTERYDRMLARIAARFPDGELVPARGLFASNDDWRRRWPVILGTVDALCVFTDEAGWIGLGVWTEVRDATIRNLPVVVLGDDGAFHTLDSVRIVAIDPEDWQQYALLHLPGEPSLIGTR